MKEHQQILIYIQEKMDQLTKHEQIIAKYIIENPEEIINLSAKSLGEVTHSSAASVIRCVHKLDFKGFTDLKLTLSRYLPSHHHKIYEEITEDETYETIANKLFSRAEHTLIETKHQINYDNLEQIIQQLK